VSSWDAVHELTMVHWEEMLKIYEGHLASEAHSKLMIQTPAYARWQGEL